MSCLPTLHRLASRSRRAAGALLVAMCLLAAPLAQAAPGLAHVAPSSGDSPSVRLVVDASALGQTSDVYEDVVAQELRTAFENSDYSLEDSVRADATVRVRIIFFNEADLDYQIEIDISAGPELVRLDSIGCVQCADEDLMAKIEGAAPKILAGLEHALAASGESPEPREPDDPGQDAPSTTVKTITALGGVGIGAAALGLGLVVAGGVELGRGRVYSEATSRPTERTGFDHRPPGAALLGVGGAVLMAGVALLAVDLIRIKNRRRQQAVAHPLAGPGLVGLGLTGRF